MSNEETGYPRAWRFQSDDGNADGPVFRGTFTGVIEQGTTAFGPKPVARFVEEATGEEISIWLMQAALTDRLRKLAPEKGELVEIKWGGKKKSKSSKFSYHAFSATCPDRPVVPLSWSDLGDPEEDTIEEEY